MSCCRRTSTQCTKLLRRSFSTCLRLASAVGSCSTSVSLAGMICSLGPTLRLRYRRLWIPPPPLYSETTACWKGALRFSAVSCNTQLRRKFSSCRTSANCPPICSRSTVSAKTSSNFLSSTVLGRRSKEIVRDSGSRSVTFQSRASNLLVGSMIAGSIVISSSLQNRGSRTALSCRNLSGLKALSSLAYVLASWHLILNAHFVS
mmetsp:Transcript_16392/g.40488  ORF Transcript_16392/g.40488 Transcript_16392/m.40488 type:complete len:204 (-) Transcript_16392:612-1223(-)